MAEVADFHISLDGFEEDEVETLGSISYWPHEFEHEEIYSSESDPDHHDHDHDPFSPSFAEFIPSDHFDEEDQRIDCFGSDTDSVAELNDFIRQDHQVNHPLDVNLDVNDDPFDEDPFFRVVGENNETGSNYLDLGLGLGRIDEEERDHEIENDENDDENGEFMIDDDIRSGDFFVGRRCESVESSEILGGVDSFDPSFEDGLRDVGIGIGLDSDEEVIDDEDDGIDFRPGGVEDEVQDELGIHLCWDCLRLDDPRESNDFYEWEDVGNRVEDRVLSMMMEFEERSVSPSIETEQAIEGRDETMRNSEWEVLLQVNSLDRNVESEHDLDHDDYIYPTEYETLFAQFAENENAIRGSPPTAKTVIESLPSIVLTQDDIKNKGSLCAVCKDEIATEEQAKLLPCSHYYHGDCILPWLNIRNTCPVCRFELPTDDPGYEQRRTQRAGRDSSAGASQVMYDFQMFPED